MKSQELVEMEKKLQKLYTTDYNFLMAIFYKIYGKLIIKSC